LSLNCNAQDISIYQNQTLEHWRGKYPENIRALFQESVQPFLNSNIRGISLEFPLRPVDNGGLMGVLSFYTTPADQTIYLPISSILFLDEICICWAWITNRNESLEPLLDYMAMIKYQNPAYYTGGYIPSPLDALNIPETWIDNRNVDDFAKDLATTALLWIMAHETGHIHNNHKTYNRTPGQILTMEYEADKFANDMFVRLGFPPKGIVPYFMATYHLLPNRGDYVLENAWLEYYNNYRTHPLNGERISIISDFLDSNAYQLSRFTNYDPITIRQIHYLADNTRMISDYMLDTDLQLLRAVIGMTITEDDLRESGNTYSQRTRENAFDGEYHGVFARALSNGQKEYLLLDLSLNRNGSQVSGRFNFGLGSGDLSGIIQGNRLTFNWNWSDSHGTGLLSLDAEGNYSMKGYMELADHSSELGQWMLRR
jgi:hypothetical protein